MKKTTPIVEEISSINFTGHIMPQSWVKNIRTAPTEKHPEGQPILLASYILADIVYWYRKKEVRDEVSGAVLGYTNKFGADMLQRSYNAYAGAYGLSKRQVKAAVDRLCELGIIHREFRTVQTKEKTLPNCMFVEPIIAGIMRVTDEIEYHTKLSTPSYKKSEGIVQNFVPHIHETTTKTTTYSIKDMSFGVEVAELFNSICVDLPTVRHPGKTQASKTAIAHAMVRAKENGWSSAEDFKPLFERVARTPFLNGKNNRSWRASFGWVVNATNFEKIISGSYKEEAQATSGDKYGDLYELAE
jgi:hypothetical protein